MYTRSNKNKITTTTTTKITHTEIASCILSERKKQINGNKPASQSRQAAATINEQPREFQNANKTDTNQQVTAELLEEIDELLCVVCAYRNNNNKKKVQRKYAI